MRSLSSLVSLLAMSALVACAGADAQPSPAAPKPTTAATATSDHDLCVALMQHARTCTDQYIPALVAARAAADKPAGIKEEYAKDSAAIVAQAKTEWASDSTDANLEAMCSRPLPHADEQRTIAVECQAKTDCNELATCLVGLQQTFWR